MTKANWWTKRH